MTLITKDLGLVQALHSGASAPTNTKLIWFDTNVSFHKYYNGSSWVPVAASAGTLNQVLTNNNDTGGVDIDISTGDKINFLGASFDGDLTSAVLTAARSWQFPDKSGTIAMTSDIAGIDLSAVLAAGNTSGGSHLIMTAGDSILSSGGAELDLQFIGAGDILLSSTGGLGSPSYLRMLSTSTTLKTGGSLNIQGDQGVNITSVSFGDILLSTFSGVIEIAGNNPTIELYSAAFLLKAQYQVDASNDLYIKNETSGASIFLHINGEDVVAIDEDGVIIGSGNTLLVNGSGAPYYDLQSGDGTGTATMGIEKSNAGTGALGMRSNGSDAYEIQLDTNEDVHYRTMLSDKSQYFISKPGGADTNSMIINGSNGHVLFDEAAEFNNETMIVGSSIAAAAAVNSTDVSVIELTGGPTTIDEFTGYDTGKLLYVVNVSASSNTIGHNGAATASKIYCEGGANKVLAQDEGILFWYSQTRSAWIQLGK